jgi:hypothetical protein
LLHGTIGIEARAKEGRRRLVAYPEGGSRMEQEGMGWKQGEGALEKEGVGRESRRGK